MSNLSDFRTQRINANKHTERGIKALDNSISKDGWIGAVTVAADGETFDGSARLEALADAMPSAEPIIVESDGTRPVIVRRTDIPDTDDPRAKRLGVAANVIAHMDYAPDGEILAMIAADDDAVARLIKQDELSADAVAAALADGLLGDADAEPQIDRAAELNEKWQVRTGDLFRIGEHRLLCGDSTKREDVERVVCGEFIKLCVTDPPYGVDYDPNWRNEAAAAGLLSYAASRVGVVNNDSINDWSIAWSLFSGDVLYCWHDATAENIFQTGIESSGFEIRNQIVWVKSNFPISRGHYTWKHESCWYAVRKGHDAGWIGDAKQCTVWDGSLDSNADGGHSTQKPVWVMAKSIANHSGDVYEPFAGSGTTLVACQNLQRKARAIEISPNYCAVILERMATAFPGIEIERVNNGTA